MGIEFLSQLLVHIDQQVIPGYLYQEIITLLARMHDYKLQILVLRLEELVYCVQVLSASSDQQMLEFLGLNAEIGSQQARMLACGVCLNTIALQSKTDICFDVDYVVSHQTIHSYKLVGCVEKTAQILRVMNEIRSLFLLMTTPLVHGSDVRLHSQQLITKNHRMSL